MNKTWFGAALLIAAAVFSPLASLAQAYPDRPIKLVAPFPPGGGNDNLARIIAAKLSESMGQTVIVDNRPGAAGNIGAQHVAKSPPDGYTLLVANNTLVITPALSKVPFDVLQDFTPVGLVGSTAVALAVHPDFPARSVPELIALLLQNPNKYSYSSCGAGTTMHLAGELLKQQARVSMAHVPYRGCGPAIIDGIAGHVPILFNTISALRAQVEQGKLRILAVFSPSRFALDPSVPTLAEAMPSLGAVVADLWLGILAPAGTPQTVVSRLNAELRAALASPDVQKRLVAENTVIQSSTPQQMGDLMRRDLERWGKLVKEAKIVVD